MGDKFHPDDLKNPVYEYSQVITVHDLKIIYRGLAVQYQDTKWWEIQKRWNIEVAGHAIYELLSWLHDGKPTLKGSGDIK